MMRDGLCLFLDDLMSVFGMFKSGHNLCPYLDIRCPRHATRAKDHDTLIQPYALPWPNYFAGGAKSFGKLLEFCHHISGHVLSL